jgi:pimeloyl-ACP methyl ester carboxylesterase
MLGGMSAPLLQPMPEVPGVEHIHLNAGGLRTHVAIAGPKDGPPVLLLHGWPQHWWLWRNVMPPLAAAGYRVHAPDLRGLGWTEATDRARDYDKRNLARDVIALLDALEIDRVRLAGHDWGGWVGFLAAILAPDRIDRYMAMNIPPPWLDPGPFDPLKALRALSRLGYQVVMSTPGLSRIAQAGIGRPIFERAIRRSADRPQAWDGDALSIYLDQFADPRRADASKFIYRRFLTVELPQIQLGRYVPDRLTTPTRLLFGLDDVAIDPAVLDGDHSRHADDLTIERVPDCGHFIVDERPELVTERLLEFFAADLSGS